MCAGMTLGGRVLFVVYQEVETGIIYVTTAYEPQEK